MEHGLPTGFSKEIIFTIYKLLALYYTWKIFDNGIQIWYFLDIPSWINSSLFLHLFLSQLGTFAISSFWSLPSLHLNGSYMHLNSSLLKNKVSKVQHNLYFRWRRSIEFTRLLWQTLLAFKIKYQMVKPNLQSPTFLMIGWSTTLDTMIKLSDFGSETQFQQAT